MPKYCPKCNTSGTTNFCYIDGTKMIERPVCECGYIILVGIDKYCPDCGKIIKSESKVA